MMRVKKSSDAVLARRTLCMWITYVTLYTIVTYSVFKGLMEGVSQEYIYGLED